MTRITRRHVLRGAGAAVALPFLESLQPASAGTEPVKPPVRMAFLYMANGVNPKAWTPQGTGRDFPLSPILEPLAKVKDDVLVLTNLWNRAANTGDGHYVKTGGWLTGTTIAKTTGSDLRSGGVSADQVAAQRIGNLTMLPSVEFSVEPVTTGVDTNVGYTRLYGSHISWSTPVTPVSREINPKLAFDRLFRTPPAAAGGADVDKSVLDLVMEDAKALDAKSGAADRRKIAEFLESVRAVERRIEFDAKRRREEVAGDPESRKAIEALGGRMKDVYLDPAKLRERGVDHTEHVRLMLDVIALAFRCDATRVATFMFGNAVSGKNFSFLEGVGGGHHQISHHENNAAKLEEYRKIGAWHVRQYATLLEHLKSIKEADGTLLDNCMVVFGAGIRDGNAHDPHNLPVVLGGRGGGTLKTGRHLVYEKDTPLCNLWKSMLARVGAPVERIGDSTGELPDLAG